MAAVACILSVAYHPGHMSCAELGCRSTVAVDIDQGEGWDSRFQVPAVGTCLAAVEGKIVVGSLVAVQQ